MWSKKKMLLAALALAVAGGVAYVIYWQVSKKKDDKKPAPPAPAAPVAPAAAADGSSNPAPAAPAADDSGSSQPQVAAARRAGFIRQRETLASIHGGEDDSESLAADGIVMRSDAPPNVFANLVNGSAVLANASIQSVVGSRSIARSV